MFHIVLVEPEIPPNTGNIIRLCANTGATLHLIEPLGFTLDDAKMRRAGLDYHEFANLHIHASWVDWLAHCQPDLARVFLFTTKGEGLFFQTAFKPGDWLVFGSETRGLTLDQRLLVPTHQRVRLPMQVGSRSLNLSNTVAIAAFEAWRQQAFAGGV
ncbi:MAG: tRNA (cytidine(34)-2'-O)-methyltransferase [Ottowia sp.]|nr:tRNA (cytidine(34)-2'-O)-methyltransferase [Ottowia sp.]